MIDYKIQVDEKRPFFEEQQTKNKNENENENDGPCGKKVEKERERERERERVVCYWVFCDFVHSR